MPPLVTIDTRLYAQAVQRRALTCACKGGEWLHLFDRDVPDDKDDLITAPPFSLPPLISTSDGWSVCVCVRFALTEKTFWSSRMSVYHASSPMKVTLRNTLPRRPTRGSHARAHADIPCDSEKHAFVYVFTNIYAMNTTAAQTRVPATPRYITSHEDPTAACMRIRLHRTARDASRRADRGRRGAAPDTIIGALAHARYSRVHIHSPTTLFRAPRHGLEGEIRTRSKT